MAVVKKEFSYGNHTVTIETGEIARQASAAVMVSMDETVVLVTAVRKKAESCMCQSYGERSGSPFGLTSCWPTRF